ncbi:MAG: hypothetical protein ACFBSG_19735 [Leptolyngbyaceae cyanobacterium]
MESASWLDIILKRLRFFSRPVPLASTVGALLLAVFIWEYVSHPEWFGAFESTSASPNQDVDLSDLTPEEQAAISGIDNLSLLFRELGVESGGVPQLQALGDSSEAEENAFLNEALAIAQPNQVEASASGNPFTQYLEQYQFGRQRSTSESAATNSSRNANSFSYFQTNSDTSTSDRYNPLTAALQNDSGQLEGDLQTTAEEDAENSALETELRSQSASGSDTSSDERSSEALTDSGLPIGEFSSQTVTVPGVNFPVLPTLPKMSPPPGTTGYTPPASLNLMPPLPGVSSAPAPSSAGVPDLSTLNGATSVNTPQVDVSNGYTPYTPTVPSAAPTTTGPTSQPFTAPRPPGSYTGGGYINTFSNPNGPSN